VQLYFRLKNPREAGLFSKANSPHKCVVFLAVGLPFHHDEFGCELMQKRGMPAPSPRSILPWAPWVGSQLLPRNELIPHTIILVSLSHYHFYRNMFTNANTHEYIQTIIPINLWKSFSTQVYWWLFRMIFVHRFIPNSFVHRHPQSFPSIHMHLHLCTPTLYNSYKNNSNALLVAYLQFAGVCTCGCACVGNCIHQ